MNVYKLYENKILCFLCIMIILYFMYSYLYNTEGLTQEKKNTKETKDKKDKKETYHDICQDLGIKFIVATNKEKQEKFSKYCSQKLKKYKHGLYDTYSKEQQVENIKHQHGLQDIKGLDGLFNLKGPIKSKGVSKVELKKSKDFPGLLNNTYDYLNNLLNK